MHIHQSIVKSVHHSPYMYVRSNPESQRYKVKQMFPKESKYIYWKNHHHNNKQKTAHLKNWRTFINKQYTNKQNPHQLSPQEATLLSSSDTAMLVNSSLWSLVWYNSCDNKERRHNLSLPLRWQTWFSSFANKFCRSHRMAH